VSSLLTGRCHVEGYATLTLGVLEYRVEVFETDHCAVHLFGFSFVEVFWEEGVEILLGGTGRTCFVVEERG